MEDLGNINEEYNKDPTGTALKSKSAWDDESFTSAELYSVEYSALKSQENVMQSVAEENTTVDDKNTGASVVTSYNTEKEAEMRGTLLSAPEER